MSGGAFNYLYSALENEPFDHLDDLENMVKFLDSTNEVEAGTELKNLLEYLAKVQKEVTDKIVELKPLMKGAEWWLSNDSSHKSFQEEVVKMFISKGQPVQAIRYYRRVNNLFDSQGFRDAKEYVYDLKQEMGK